MPDFLPRGQVERVQICCVVDLIDEVAVDDRRRKPEPDAGLRPQGLLDVALLRSVDRRNHPPLGQIDVLIAVRHDHGAALHHDARVDGALGGHETPYLFARLGLHRVNRAVPDSVDQQPQTINRGHKRRSIRRVVRPASWIRRIHDVAGPLVERHEAVRPGGHRAPARDG